MKFDYKIQHLWERFTSGAALSEADEVVANALLQCGSPFGEFVAKLVILTRRGAGRADIFRLLEDECSLGYSRSTIYAVQVLFLAGNFSLEAIRNSKPVREYVLTAARSGDASARLNSAHLLAVLASHYSEASALLDELCMDKSDDVRTTASSFRSEIRDTGMVSRIF